MVRVMGGVVHNLGPGVSFLSESGHQNLNVRHGLLITIALESTSEPRLWDGPGPPDQKAAQKIQLYHHPQASRTLGPAPPGKPPDGHVAQEQALEPGD